MLLTPYTLNMGVHLVMYSYYFSSIFITDFDKIISVKKSITIMQMVSRNSHDCQSNKLIFIWLWTELRRARTHGIICITIIVLVFLSIFRCNLWSFFSTACGRTRRRVAWNRLSSSFSSPIFWSYFTSSTSFTRKHILREARENLRQPTNHRDLIIKGNSLDRRPRIIIVVN